MATPLTGRYCSVKINAAACSSDATLIGNLGHWEINFALDELDASVFGTVWKKNVVGMIGWSGTVEGFFDPSTEADSQITALMNAAMDGTKIQDIRFYHTTTGLFWMPNWTTYGNSTTADQGCYISNFRVTADKNALNAVSFSLTGYGDLALHKGDVSAIVIEGT